MPTDNPQDNNQQQVIDSTENPIEDKSIKHGMLNDELSRILKDTQQTTDGGVTQEPPAKKFEEMYDMQFIKDLDDKDFERIDEEMKKRGLEGNNDLRYYLITKENDFKKQQRLASARDLEVQNAKKESADYTEFINGLKKDFKGTYERYKDKFGLPETDFVSKQVNGQSVSEKLAVWQEQELVPFLTKKFNLEEEEFAYDSSDAYRANTPSYDYRVLTEKKEKELSSEYEQYEAKQKEQLETVVKRRDEALSYLQQNYFNGNNDEFTSYLQKLDGMSDKMKDGKFDAETNPFDLVNIFRGVFFEDLVNKKVKEVTSQLHKAYNEKGMYLPSRDVPPDVTNVNGTTVNNNPPSTKKRFGRLNLELTRYK